VTITPEEIARLRALEAAATPRPWEQRHEDISVRDGDDYLTYGGDLGGAFYQADNCAVAVAARNALPALLDEIERLRADLREAVTLLDGWAQPSGHVDEWHKRVAALLAKHKEPKP